MNYATMKRPSGSRLMITKKGKLDVLEDKISNPHQTCDVRVAPYAATKKDDDVNRNHNGIDEFPRVKRTIDDHIAQLLKKKTDEIKHKDFCADDSNINPLETDRKKSDPVAKIDNLPADVALTQTSLPVSLRMRPRRQTQQRSMII